MASTSTPDQDALGIDRAALTPSAQRIVDVASELFYRRGINAVGVDTIAEESGITKRTLYNRFGSKDTLVATYLRARHEQWWSLVEQRISEHRGPKVLGVIDAYLGGLLPDDRGCAFLNAAGELPDGHPARRIISDHKAAVLELLTGLLREDYPSHADPSALAEELFLIAEGALALRGGAPSLHLTTRARIRAQEAIADLR